MKEVFDIAALICGVSIMVTISGLGLSVVFIIVRDIWRGRL